MGAWGPGLFSDDIVCDVRDEYRASIEDGLDDDAATRQILVSYADVIDDPDDGPVVWLAPLPGPDRSRIPPRSRRPHRRDLQRKRRLPRHPRRAPAALHAPQNILGARLAE